MSGRTPSFIVVGLVIIMFLLGLFYMSCSSKNNELRLSLEQFEERIRSLTIKESDSEKKIESLNTRKRELEEEKITVQRQMEKKDSEINELTTKLNERQAELQSLKSDKQVLDEQLREFKSMTDIVAAKNSLIEKLQQQLADQKQSSNNEVSRLNQEVEGFRNRPSQNNAPLANDRVNSFQNPHQRFQPLLSDNLTTKLTDSFLQNPIEKLGNMTNEARSQFVPVVAQLKDRVLNVFGVDRNASSTTTLSNQQALGDANNRVNQPPSDPNVPAPPLANYAQRRQQPDHVESAQGPPQAPYENNRLANNDQNQQRFQRSLNGNVSDHGNAKGPNDQEEADDENADDLRNDQPNLAEPPSNIARRNQFGNENQPVVPAVPSRLNNENNYRIGDRDQFRHVRNGARRARQLDNDEQLGERNNGGEQQEQRRNYV